MNDALNTKILLTLYKRIPEEIRRNEKKVLKIASRSFYGYGAAETMKTYEKIIDMNDEKIRLINLKLLIDKAFNLDCGKAASLHGISLPQRGGDGGPGGTSGRCSDPRRGGSGGCVHQEKPPQDGGPCAQHNRPSGAGLPYSRN